jgi:hypothetical protein
MPKGRPLCLQVIISFVVLLDLLKLTPLLQVHTCYDYITQTPCLRILPSKDWETQGGHTL